MARIFKEEEYQAKRNEILDFSTRLIYSKGYALMTIQDILDGLHISRGALYHYFDSKQALLEAMVERMGGAAVEAFLPILQDPHLTAIQKFRRYFEVSAQWKSAGKALILSTFHMWYSDSNATFRQKMASKSIKGTAPILESMIQQGVAEQVFTVHNPRQVAEIIAGVALSLADSAMEQILASPTDPAAFQKAESMLDTYFDVIERILGAQAGSLKVFGAEAFKEWFVDSQPEPASP